MGGDQLPCGREQVDHVALDPDELAEGLLAQLVVGGLVRGAADGKSLTGSPARKTRRTGPHPTLW